MIYDLQNRQQRSSKIPSQKLDGGLEPVLATFEMLNIGCLIVSCAGQVVSRNKIFEQLKLDLYPGWLRSRSKATDQIITNALERVRKKARRVSRKLPELGIRIIVHRLKGWDESDAFLVTFHTLGTGEKPPASDRFSPVEVEILECISKGQNLRETASIVRIPYNTVRKYVQNLLVKTSCRTQAHLIAHYVGAKGALITKDGSFKRRPRAGKAVAEPVEDASGCEKETL